MTFSVKNSNLIHSVEFSPYLVQMQVREIVFVLFLARLDIPIQVSHMVEVMQRYFKVHHLSQGPMTENQLGEMQIMKEVAEHVGMHYPDTLDTRFVAQPVNGSLYFLGRGIYGEPNYH